MLKNRKIRLFNLKLGIGLMIPFGVSNLINIRTFSTTKDLLLNDNNNLEENSNVTPLNSNDVDASNTAPLNPNNSDSSSSEDGNISDPNSEGTNDTDTSDVDSENLNNDDDEENSDSENIDNDDADNTSSSDISDVLERYKDKTEEELDDYIKAKREKLERTFEEDNARNEAENASDPEAFQIRKEEIDNTYNDRMDALRDRQEILNILHNDYNNQSPESPAAESSSSDSPMEESPVAPEQTETQATSDQAQAPAAVNQQSPLDYVLEIEDTEMPDLYSADGGD